MTIHGWWHMMACRAETASSIKSSGLGNPSQGSPPTVLPSSSEDPAPQRYGDFLSHRGTPKSAIFMGFFLINHPFWGTPIYGTPHIDLSRLLWPLWLYVEPSEKPRNSVNEWDISTKVRNGNKTRVCPLHWRRHHMKPIHGYLLSSSGHHL